MDTSKRKAFAEDGAVLIEGFLNAEQLAKCRAAYDWCVENPGPLAVELFASTEKETHNENAQPGRGGAPQPIGFVDPVRRIVRRSVGLEQRLVLRRRGLS